MGLELVGHPKKWHTLAAKNRSLIGHGEVGPHARLAAAVIERAWLDITLSSARIVSDVHAWVQNNGIYPCSLEWCAQALSVDSNWLRKVFLKEISYAYQYRGQ